MSARDSSAIRYVATLIHRKNGKRECLCEKRAAYARVVKLATAYVDSRRRITESKRKQA